MSSPPADLSLHVGPSSILAPAGISVKDVIPALTRCPFCSSVDSFTIYLDPIRSGQGHWLRCHACGFGGDTIETFGKIHKISNLRHVVHRLVSDGLFRGESSLITTDAVQAYIERCVQPRHRIRNILIRLFCPDRRVPPPLLDLLQARRLWCGQRTEQQARLQKFFGYGTKREIVGLFNSAVLPRHGFKNCLVLNFQDVPGRTCRILFVDQDGAEACKDVSGVPPPNQEGGLMMLEALDTFEKTVFAVPDYQFALDMQRLHLADSTRPLKLVVYNEDTRNAWKSVLAERVILWARELNYTVFQQARLSEHGWIAVRPSTKVEDLYEYTGKFLPEDVLGRMERSAKPWQVALVDYLMEPSRSDTEGQALIQKLGLRTDERRQILDECPPRYRERIDYFLGESVTVQSIGYGANQMLDRHDGWFAENKNGKEEPVCDARIRVHYEITEPEHKKVYWKGIVLCRNQQLPFQDDTETIRKNTAKWLSDFMGGAGHGTPTISPKYKNALFFLAQQFSLPRRLTISNRVGLRPNGKVIYPRFMLEGGEVQSEEAFMCPPEAPGWNLKAPEPRLPRPADQVSRLRACWVATAGVFLHNMLRAYREEPPVPVLLIGAEGSTARWAGTHLGRTADMPYYRLEPRSVARPTHPSWAESVRACLDRYGYPSLVETAAQNLLYSWPVRNSDNVFLTVTPLEAAALRTGGNWLCVEAPEVRQDLEQLPPFDDVLMYLVDLQRRKFQLPELPLFEAVMQDWVGWYKRYACLDESEDLAQKVRRCLTPQQMPSEVLVELCGMLHSENRLKLEYTNFIDGLRAGTVPSGDRVGIWIDSTDRRVFLSRPALRKALSTARLPQSELGAATEDLVRRQLMVIPNLPVEGWILPLSFFEETIRAWQLRRQNSANS